MNIVFMGTPDFAATVLRHVAAWPGCEVVAAYCQPDRPAGRGHKLQPPAGRHADHARADAGLFVARGRIRPASR